MVNNDVTIDNVIEMVDFNDTNGTSMQQSVADDTSRNLTGGTIDLNIVAPVKSPISVQNRFDIFNVLDENVIVNLDRKRPRSVNSPASEDAEPSVPPSKTPTPRTPPPKSQRKSRREEFSLRSSPPTPLQMNSPPTPTEFDAAPTENTSPNLFASQTFANNAVRLPRVSSSQPLPNVRNAKARRSLLPVKTVHQQVKISVHPLDSNIKSTIGSKTIIEDKTNINIELTENIKILIIGDSNLRNMEAKLFNPDWHILCIPGGNLDLICSIIEQLPNSLQLTDIIVTAGYCDLDDERPPIEKCLTALNRIKVRKHFLGLSCNTRALSPQQQKILTRINDFAANDDSTNYIKPPLKISFMDDGIHLRPISVKLITDSLWQHMERFLCQASKRTWKMN